MTGGADDARQRAAATLRNRSRNKLLTVARDIFDSLGWEQTKVIDVAAAAGLQRTDRLQPLQNQARFSGARLRPTGRSPDRCRPRRHHAVKGCGGSGTAVRVGPGWCVGQHPTLAIVVLLPVEGDEPRLFGQLVEALARLVQEGARQGVFTSRQPAYQIARYHIRALLSLAAMGDNEVTELALSQMLPALMSGNP